MKIKKFNESDKFWPYKPHEKILKVSFGGTIYVKQSDIEKTDKYREYIRKDNITHQDALLLGLEEYCYDQGEPTMSWQLYDGNGDKIEDEKQFDEEQKYNL